MFIFRRYGAAFLGFALFILAPLQVALAGGLTLEEVFQLMPIAAAAIISFFVPLLKGSWAGGLKTGVNVIATAAVAVIPFLSQGYLTAEQWAIVIGAALQAAAVEFGVVIRKDPEVKAIAAARPLQLRR